MQLYNLGHVSWLDSQLIYHAQPRVGLEAINILAPSEPYVCIGYHQDLSQEVDVGFCRHHGIPIFRREVGGGAVYLDGNQIFYQLVLHKDNPLAQGDKASLYRRLLQPVVEACGDLGVPAQYRPINDIVTAQGRKISGNGAATIGDYFVLVGNLIADFDYESMSRVLRVPDEKYRDKVFKSMQENLTTLKRETGRVPTWDEMVAPLLRRFEALLGRLQPAALPQAVNDQMELLAPQFLRQEWLFKQGKSQRIRRDVKITADVRVVQRVHKAPGGLVRATMKVGQERLHNVSLSGDFFCYPADGVEQLESILEGVPVSEVRDVLVGFCARYETPGVTVEDWLEVLVG